MTAETTEHTPSLAQVRQLYANSMDPAGFDRWLAEERRAAAEKAWNEGVAAVDPYAVGAVPMRNPYRMRGSEA